MKYWKSFNYRFVLFFSLAQLALAAETDAEILKDLDLFMNLEILSEPSVMEEIPDDWETEKPTIKGKGGSDGL